VLWVIKLINDHTAMGQRNGLRPGATPPASKGSVPTSKAPPQAPAGQQEDDDVASIERH